MLTMARPTTNIDVSFFSRWKNRTFSKNSLYLPLSTLKVQIGKWSTNMGQEWSGKPLLEVSFSHICTGWWSWLDWNWRQQEKRKKKGHSPSSNFPSLHDAIMICIVLIILRNHVQFVRPSYAIKSIAGCWGASMTLTFWWNGLQRALGGWLSPSSRWES